MKRYWGGAATTLLVALALTVSASGGAQTFAFTGAEHAYPVPPSPAPTTDPSGAQRAQIIRSYERLPLAFEENRGQAPPGVRYLAHGPGYGIALNRTGIHVALAGSTSRGHRATNLSLTLRGAHPRKLSASHPLPGTTNYLNGHDRSRWVTDVESFSRVTYRRAWPGIDALVDGRQRALRYDFRLRPGADPGRIAIGLHGARASWIDRRGRLMLRLRGGRVVQDRPAAYQRIGGERRRVAVRYALSGRTVQIHTGRYDRARPLFIDPTLDYSTFLGGGGSDSATGIAVDAAGSAYVTGYTEGLPTTAGAFQTTKSGFGYDAFVTKLAPDGSALSYSTYLGGANDDKGYAIAVDAAGAAYVTGLTSSANFATTPGALQTTSGGGEDVFVTKLAPDGSALSYSSYLGDVGNEQSYGIAVDAAGSAYVAGTTSSTDFPTTAGAFQPANAGGRDAFVTKLAPSGSVLSYSSYLGGSACCDEAHGVAVDSTGAAYVTGIADSPDFPVTPGAFDTDQTRFDPDAFVTKLVPTGSALAYSTHLGGSDYDAGLSLAIDSAGSAYVFGRTLSSDFPTPAGAFPGGDGSFVTKLAPDGSALSYSTSLPGGACTCPGQHIAVDSAGAAWVSSGVYYSAFPVTANALQSSPSGISDAVMARLAPDGSALSYSSYLGGASQDQGYAIAVDSAGSAYVAGVTASRDFPTTAGAFQTIEPGNADAFVAKLSPFAGEPTATCTVTGTPGNDTLQGTIGPDTICGLGGNDVIDGLRGDDRLLGGVGNDLLVGSRGDDALDGGPGRDLASYTENAGAGIEANLATGIVLAAELGTDTIASAGGLSTVERIDATRFDDGLTGDLQANELNGAQGSDTISGGGGADILTGGLGGDTLSGERGADRLGPGPGDDQVSGGPQSDTLRYAYATGGGVAVNLAAGIAFGLGGSNVGNDTLAADIENVTGSPGNDTLGAKLAGIASAVVAGDGADTIGTSDGDALDTVKGGAGVDSCSADAGDKRLGCP